MFHAIIVRLEVFETIMREAYFTFSDGLSCFLFGRLFNIPAILLELKVHYQRSPDKRD